MIKFNKLKVSNRNTLYCVYEKESSSSNSEVYDTGLEHEYVFSNKNENIPLPKYMKHLDAASSVCFTVYYLTDGSKAIGFKINSNDGIYSSYELFRVLKIKLKRKNAKKKLFRLCGAGLSDKDWYLSGGIYE